MCVDSRKSSPLLVFLLVSCPNKSGCHKRPTGGDRIRFGSNHKRSEYKPRPQASFWSQRSPVKKRVGPVSKEKEGGTMPPIVNRVWRGGEVLTTSPLYLISKKLTGTWSLLVVWSSVPRYFSRTILIPSAHWCSRPPLTIEARCWEGLNYWPQTHQIARGSY